MAICLWINFNECWYLIILWRGVVGKSIVKIWVLCVCPYLFKKFFKKSTETCTLLQKSSRKSYERIHHNSIFIHFVLNVDDEMVNFWKWKIHHYRPVSFSRVNFLKNQQKPTFCYKNPQENRMNAYTRTWLLYVLCKTDFWKLLKIRHWLWKMKKSLIQRRQFL